VTKPAPLFGRLALIGVGLIGSSIARAARAQGVVREIVAAFVAEHHVERPIYKRKRDCAGPEAQARRAPMRKDRHE